MTHSSAAHGWRKHAGERTLPDGACGGWHAHDGVDPSTLKRPAHLHCDKHGGSIRVHPLAVAERT